MSCNVYPIDGGAIRSLRVVNLCANQEHRLFPKCSLIQKRHLPFLKGDDILQCALDVEGNGVDHDSFHRPRKVHIRKGHKRKRHKNLE